MSALHVGNSNSQVRKYRVFFNDRYANIVTSWYIDKSLRNVNFLSCNTIGYRSKFLTYYVIKNGVRTLEICETDVI